MSLLSAITLTLGMWHGTLTTPGGELPFGVEIRKQENTYTLTVINGEEQLVLDEISLTQDSLIARFPVYESELRLKIIDSGFLEGSFINLTRSTHASIPMQIKYGSKSRFPVSEKNIPIKILTKYAAVFSPGTPDSSVAVGVFNQVGNEVTGTFLTPSGDYRYLHGNVDGDSLHLSTFNGVFVYLFKAKIENNRLIGKFYSGTHYSTNWAAVADENAQLPDPDKLTTITDAHLPLELTFPDLDSLPVSLSDPRFNGKVIVIQILGSWCPNCLDESQFLAPYYDKNQHKGFEIIGLAFEKTDTFSKAVSNVKRLQKRFKINYPLLIASNRDKIRKTMPRLNNFIGFPTTIILDKSHKVRKVHAGFSGAATGIAYEQYKDEFHLFIEKLLAE
ncbi:MAG: TlpA family protein disulfide reductase [Bacteroidetes bacterium]|nr:TlpA family protein disulfide reductase [Bacteroidota bacterium]